MNWYESDLYKAKKDLILTQALSHYYDNVDLSEDDNEILEDVMRGFGFFSEEESTKRPMFSVLNGQGKTSKKKQKVKLKSL